MGISVLSVALIRILVILVASALGYFGYRLFTLGLFQKAGDLKAAFGSTHLTVKAAARGTFFGLFSACVLVFALTHPINVETKTASGGGPGLTGNTNPGPTPSNSPSPPPSASPGGTQTPKTGSHSASVLFGPDPEATSKVVEKAAKGEALICYRLKFQHLWGWEYRFECRLELSPRWTSAVNEAKLDVKAPVHHGDIRPTDGPIAE